ncbi:hypothetical protein [uncultured Thermomonospora sp.]|uniref:hypothetical protein n=1 Tax=uncultured Thermomonospora sp. TaxID=671175 RepID=UPI00259B4705|nr:hypothetical protein [uncultured Thermomonospora sp.]
MTDPLGVQIGAREIYDRLGDVDRKVDAVGSKVDRLVDAHDVIRGDIGELREDIRDHEDRLRTLERGRWPLPSLAALCSIAAVAIALIGLMTKGG